MKQSSKPIPSDLLQLKERFERWRCTWTGSNKTPLGLSKEAVTLSYKYGITLTSKQLGLNHVTLKAQRQKFPEAFVTHLLEKIPTQALVLKTQASSMPIKTHFIELTSRTTSAYRKYKASFLNSSKYPFLKFCTFLRPNSSFSGFAFAPNALVF
jgi:hypothetical protein